jgi:PAS domain S-box-containing protein
MSSNDPDGRPVLEGELFRLMVENVRDFAIFALDLDGKVSTWNPGAERVFGWAERDILGQDGAVLFTPEDRAAGVPAREQATARSAGRAEDERWHVRADGSRFFASGVLTPILDGRLRGYAKVCRDVTARKRAEDELARSERWLRTVADSLPTLVSYVGADHRYRFANRAYVEWFGLTPDQVVGRDMRDLLGEDVYGHRLPYVAAALRGERVRFEGPTWHRALGRRVTDVAYVPHAPDGAGGTVDGFFVLVHDVTDRKAGEEALRASEGRHRFLADLAAAVHPLTNPDEIMAATARRLGDHLGADRCAYAEIEGEAVYVITGDYSRGVPSIVGRWPVAGFGAEHHRVMKAGQPYVVHDTDADPRIGPADLPAYRATDIRSVICLPLHKAGRLTAAMAVHQAAPRRWTPDEVELVRVVVGRCWEALERARVERTLRESEGRYRTLFMSIDEGYCVIEVLFDAASRPADYRFLEVNPAFERHTGLVDATGRTVRDLAPGHEAHWFEAYGRVAETGEPVRFENEAKALGGRWFDVYAFRLGGPGGRKVAVLFTDVTERKRAEAALRASEERLRRMVSIDVVGVLIFEASTGTLVDANDAFLRTSGYARGEVEARALTWRTMTPPEHVAASERQMEGFAATGRVGPYEKEYFRKDGSRSWMVFAGAALGDGTVVEYCIDVSDRKRIEERLKEEYRRKDEFLAMLAHELRNPLAPLRNALQILQLRGTDLSVVEHVRGIMERQVGHLGRLVDDLLDVSRVTTGKVQLRKERLDLARLVREGVADHRATYEAKGVTLAVAIPDAPVWVSGDPTRLAQVLDNLLTNALKFTARDGEVSVSVAADAGGGALLAVRDTGAGIEREMLARLFEPFSQADRTLDRSAGGLGLGLAVVKGLAELHGGSVRAESAGLGRGAAFTVTLPAYAEPPALTSQPAAPRRAASRLRVLVVEDNRDAADSLKMLLELYGYEVAVAYSGPDGVRAAGEHRPEVVICDVGLPGMDGYRVAQALRGNPATSAARLIALTGYGQDEDRRRAKAAGFDEHLTKPADPATLEALIAAAG